MVEETNTVTFEQLYSAMKQAEKNPASLLPGDHIYVLRSVSYAHHGKILFIFLFFFYFNV